MAQTEIWQAREMVKSNLKISTKNLSTLMREVYYIKDGIKEIISEVSHSSIESYVNSLNSQSISWLVEDMGLLVD